MLVDTNIVSAHFKGDPAVTSKLQAVQVIYLPSIVLGELIYGAHKSPNATRNLARIEQFRSATVLLNVDSDTAAIYGRLKSDLSSAGKMIPENDLWIAALAIQHNLPLTSRDQHFGHVSGLDWQTW